MRIHIEFHLTEENLKKGNTIGLKLYTVDGGISLITKKTNVIMIPQ